MKKKISLIIVAIFVATAMLVTLSACTDDHYDLVYANWNLSTEAVNNIERQMVKAFEEKYNVKIKIEGNISQTAYDDSINALAAKDALPDVFMLSNINFGLSNKYVMDIAEYAQNDADWDKIPAPIENAVHYKNGIYAIPFAMHMMGYFVNVDLLEQYNLDEKLNQEFNYENFFSIVQTMSNNKADGVLGLNREDSIIEWYPSSVNADYGWYTWDGEAYHLDSNEFKDGMEKARTMFTNGMTYEGLTDEEKEASFSGVEGSTDLWNQGNLALRWGATYEVPDMLDKNGGSFGIRFLGVPGGRTPVVGDYLAISKSCANPELAYKFAKWMSFGPDGIQERINRESDVTNTLPLTTDQTIIDAYFDKFQAVDGIKDMYDTLSNGIVESVKVVPGYTRARTNALTGLSVTVDGVSIPNIKIGDLILNCWQGRLTYADYATSANKLANEQYAKAIKEYESFYK